jgi:hypothetical protein
MNRPWSAANQGLPTAGRKNTAGTFIPAEPAIQYKSLLQGVGAGLQRLEIDREGAQLLHDDAVPTLS